jgi:hypothetical protein
MSTINDGGPAFPEGLHAANVELAGGRYDGAYVSRYEQIDSGMSLRDYFAAKAMQGMLADHTFNHEPEMIASLCYGMADAMLKARQS